MTANNLKYALPIILLLIACTNGQVLAQTHVRPGPASPEEIKNTQAAVESSPDSLKVHEAYIYAMSINNPLLEIQYKLWMKKYPKNVNFPLAIGTAYYDAEMPQAKQFLLKAAEMEPKNAKVWSMLSTDAYRWGQTGLSTEYMKKATQADPENADYACNYLMSFENSDPNYQQRVFDFVKRFPKSERGAQALYWLAERSKDHNKKINYFETLRKLYPPEKFTWSAAGMIDLADIYLQEDPAKALELINEMGSERDWQIRKHVAGSLLQINELERAQNYKDAIIILNQLKLPAYNQIKDFIALKKASLQEKAGDIKAAYDSLSVKFAKLPTDQLDTALELYGKKIGKDEAQVAKDIQAIRNSTAAPAYPFELDLYTGNGKLNLKDLKGKVVLLTFWFPGCGPCEEEFPHFQAVIDKFKGDDVVYVAINVLTEQDAYVLPFVKNNKYSFIPLRGSPDFALKNYGVRAEPGNFLIDKDGRIIFRRFLINNSNQRTLELMITSLLHEDRQGE